MFDDPPPPIAGVRRHDLPRTSLTWPPLPSTGPGQIPFSTRIDRHLADCRRHGQQLAVLAIGIDSIDTLDGQSAPGLESGVVLEFGHRLRSRVRSTDVVVWLGGREHGVVLLDCRRDGALAVQRRLSLALGGLYRLGPELLAVTLSLGCACYPASGDSGAPLLAAAIDARTQAAPA